MVRYDKCVESLYDRGLIEDKTKSLQMLKVMKGAISMSKSKTGECIFRTNKLEKKNLERLVKVDKRNSQYNIARVDTNKRSIVGRWMKMLDKQTTCSSQTLLEEVLYIREPNIKSVKTISSSENSPRQSDDWKLKKYLDLRLARDESIPFKKPKRPETEVAGDGETEKQEENGDEGFVTERKEIRDKYKIENTVSTESLSPERKIHGITLSKSLPLTLPSLPRNAGHTHSQTAHTPETKRENNPPLLEQDLTDWKEWRLKDKNWIYGYLRKEKTRHEDLVIRNALMKIDNEMSGAHSIRRQQIRQKLQEDREEEVRREREATMEKLCIADDKRSKSVTFERVPKPKLKKSQTEIPVEQNQPKEQTRKLSREKTVTYADDVSFTPKPRPSMSKRNKTICIVYQEPVTSLTSDSFNSEQGSPKNSQSPRNIGRRKSSTISALMTDTSLPLISESPEMVSPGISTFR